MNDLEENIFSDTESLIQEKIIIKVVGVGGGGNNAITYMYNQGNTHVSYALCNTDSSALRNSPVPTKLLLGPTVTKGLGAGNDPKVAQAAAEESVPEITKLFDDDTQMVFITAGMGGGTGTGAGPVVARVAHELGLLTIGIVTIPFLMEGKTKILKALEGAAEMGKYVDALLIINNEILIEKFGDLDLISAFGKADDTLANAANSIAEIIYKNGKINLDFNDVNTTLRNSGAAIISTGYGEGENRVTQAIHDALNSPLLRDNDYKTSKRLLFNLYYNPNSSNPVRATEIRELEEFTRKIRDLDVIYGVAFDETLGERIKISILAAGFKSNLIKHTAAVGNDIESSTIDNIFKPNQSQGQKVHHTDEEINIMRQVYGDTKIGNFQRHRDAQNFIILTSSMAEDDKVLELLEKIPAYNRSHESAESIRNGKSIEPDSPVEINFNTSSNPESDTSRKSENKPASDDGGYISFDYFN